MGLDVCGYGIVRSLAREGVPVVGLWRRDDEAGRFSRYCRAVQVEPDHDERWIAALLELAQEYDRPALFPSSDRYAALVVRHRAVLEPVTRYDWVDAALLDTVLDKARIHTVCARAGLPIPRTHHPAGADVAAEAAAAGLPFPLLVKPRVTYTTTLPDTSKALAVRDPAALSELYRRWPRLLETTLWQEIIAGEDDAIWQATAFAHQPGQALAIACMRKIRQFPPGYGITSFGRTEQDADVIALTARLVGALGWSGIASVEFKRSARDGRCYFIEMNPRLPWYNVLFRDAGINLAYLRWCHLTGAPLPPLRQSDGVGWTSLASDATSFWRRRRAGTLGTAQWLRSLGSARSFSWFEQADPEPAIATALRLSARAWRAAPRRDDA